MKDTTIQETIVRCISCISCREITLFQLDQEKFLEWRHGALIQDTFPELSKGERELLISGICGSCFNKMYELEA